jgi:hypothetical protein
MSYEDLEKARAKRAAKDAAKAKGKGKRGRKRKSPAPEAYAPEAYTGHGCTSKNYFENVPQLFRCSEPPAETAGWNP